MEFAAEEVGPRLEELIERAEGGEVIILTLNGKPVAQLNPV